MLYDTLKLILLACLVLLCVYSAVLKGLQMTSNDYVHNNESRVFLSIEKLSSLLCTSGNTDSTCTNIIRNNYLKIKKNDCHGYIDQYESCLYKNTNCNILIGNVNACMYMSHKQLLL